MGYLGCNFILSIRMIFIFGSGVGEPSDAGTLADFGHPLVTPCWKNLREYFKIDLFGSFDLKMDLQ